MTFWSATLAILIIAGIGLSYSYFFSLNKEKKELISKVKNNEVREDFARAIFQSLPNENGLAEVLQNYFPQMFPGFDFQFWMFLERSLWNSANVSEKSLASISAWMLKSEGIEMFQTGDSIPWEEKGKFINSCLFARIQPEGNDTPIAGISLTQSKDINRAFSVQSIIDTEKLLNYSIDYISNFLAILQKTEQDEQWQQVQQEIAIAAQIQSDLLPIEYPKMPGWQLSFSLQPAGNLSGDFFDLIQISESRIGILIADVAGKGLGAALYMALCRTLIRTFAKEYASRPDLVISECNERILEDARDALFITVFYGVLDLERNSLSYANAGHNPPFLISKDPKAKAKALPLTGLPIGIDNDEEWSYENITFAKGDILMMYSDGIPDAQNSEDESFGDQRLLAFSQKHRNESASQFQDHLLENIKSFTGPIKQFDDMTLLVLKRENE